MTREGTDPAAGRAPTRIFVLRDLPVCVAGIERIAKTTGHAVADDLSGADLVLVDTTMVGFEEHLRLGRVDSETLLVAHHWSWQRPNACSLGLPFVAELAKETPTSEFASAIAEIARLGHAQRWVSDHFDLSTREHEIRLGLEAGLTNRAIAEHLHLSTHTVKTHVSRVLRKLNAPSRTVLAVDGFMTAARSTIVARHG